MSDATSADVSRAVSPCMAKLDKLNWVATDWFDIEGYRLGVRTTSRGFSEWLRHTLSVNLVDGPETDDDFPLYSVVVEDGVSDTGKRAAKRFHIIYYGTWDIVRTLDVTTIARSLLHEIDSFTFPLRDDAVYVEASVIRLGDRVAVVPAILVKPLCEVGRRLRSKLDITLPGQMSIAIDPKTGDLIPPGTGLPVASDWKARLLSSLPLATAEDPDPRAMVEMRTPADLVLSWVREPYPVVQRGERGRGFYEYAKQVRNAPKVGAKSILALERLFGAAEYREFQYFSWQQAVEVFGALADGRDYVWEGREANEDDLVEQGAR